MKGTARGPLDVSPDDFGHRKSSVKMSALLSLRVNRLMFWFFFRALSMVSHSQLGSGTLRQLLTEPLSPH